MNLIALAVPLFFLAIGIEFYVAKKRGVKIYRAKSAIADLSCGIGSQVFGLLVEGGLAFAYHSIYTKHRFFTFESNSWVTWVFAYLFIDFAYYWWHRASHRINFLWGVHVVHHQSQDYNLAVALRQAWLSGITSWPFYLPLAFFGVATPVYLANKALNTLYQFWIHTELFQKRRWLDVWLNTPSAHRVHHAINPKYLDKNYASTLMVWDRVFGTYKEETDACVYGTVKPYTSWNAIWCNFDYFSQMREVMSRCQSWFGKLSVIWLPPDRVPSELNQTIHIPEVDRRQFSKFDTAVSRSVMARMFLEMGVVVVVTTWLLFVGETLAPANLIAWVTSILLFLGSWGMASDNHRYARNLDFIKWPLALLIIAASYAL
ncbi:MAG: sterol desaturase family protein [Bdellovibrionales bacterium]|nr:sterol desaturase family protein [Bdellovibrionales bacterium]